MSHTFSIHLNPKNTDKEQGKKQKKKMDVTHILNPPKPRKILKKQEKREEEKREEENGCHTHSQST